MLIKRLSEQTSAIEQPADDVDKNLVRYAFAALIHFKDLAETRLDEAIEIVVADTDNNYMFDAEDPIYKAYVKACSMRVWRRNIREEIKKGLKNTLTQEFKRKFKEENPSAKPLEELSDV